MDNERKKVAFVQSLPTVPGEVGSFCLESKTEKILTSANKALLDEVHIVDPETVEFKALEGWNETG